jgi:formylglycine-generating enzyme required for sulfatase activity
MRTLSSVIVATVVAAAGMAACSSETLTIDGPDDGGGGGADGSVATDGSTPNPGTEDGSVSKPDASTTDSGGGGQDSGDASLDADADAAPPVPTCTDGIQNQNETDVDCGGLCATKCMLLQTCALTTDCVATAVCLKGFCAAATANDGVLNNGETDIDCGGPNAPPCAANLGCIDNADCVSKNCTFNVCQPATSNDGIQNQGETGIDCGGPTAPPCAQGLGCKVNTDCVDLLCDAVKLTCSPVKCNDGVKNGKETDVDCGGSTCNACAVGKVCQVGGDCGSGSCVGGLCAAPTCMDGVQNQGETDIDCGGALCAKCANGKRCTGAVDCTGGACTGATCTDASCSNGVKDNAETDVDCGGPLCGKCDTGKTCAVAGDCATDKCTGTTCTTATSCVGGGAGKSTCGATGNEDCCATLAVPGGSIGTGKTAWTVSPYRLDKYEITVGRMRAFLASKGYNLRGNPPAAGAGSHAKIPDSGWRSAWNNRLPASQANTLLRAGVTGGNSGCFGGQDATTWTNGASANDPKAANCFDWYTLFAFCAWDGGYLPTEREWQFAAQGGSENRTFAFGSPPGFPKANDFLPACGNPGEAPCQDANTYTGIAYKNNGGKVGFSSQLQDPAYPMFLQAPGKYVVHAFCLLQGDRWCFSYTGPNANGVNAPNASHVAPPGQKLDIARWGQADMSGNLIEWTLDNSVAIDPVTGYQKVKPACVGTDCANVDYVDYRVVNLDPTGKPIVGDTSAPGVPSYWRNYSYDGAGGTSSHDLEATYQQDGGRVMRGGSWEIAHPVTVSTRYGNYPVYRSYYAAGARCARPY